VPLVLTQNESTESGHRYADELGVEYEYPTLYRNRIRPGEPFVYYRGRRRAEGGLQPQVYLGTGVVGAIRPSETEGRLLCSIEDFDPFTSPLPFKLDGGYLEPLGGVPPDRAGLYFRQGVREIDEETYARILAAAAALDPSAGRRKQEAALPWAPPEVARLVDEIAMEIAVGRLEADHPNAAVRRMPHNNPGYDIRLEDDAGVRYVEVKGTTRALPHFFMSEGERLFSHDHAADYTLLIVYAVDTEERAGRVLMRDGAVGGDDLVLQPVQWEGALAAPGSEP
jgi:hypothetical protein